MTLPLPPSDPEGERIASFLEEIARQNAEAAASFLRGDTPVYSTHCSGCGARIFTGNSLGLCVDCFEDDLCICARQGGIVQEPDPLCEVHGVEDVRSGAFAASPDVRQAVHAELARGAR